jgi:hypothetical protein
MTTLAAPKGRIRLCGGAAWMAGSSQVKPGHDGNLGRAIVEGNQASQAPRVAASMLLPSGSITNAA